MSLIFKEQCIYINTHIAALQWGQGCTLTVLHSQLGYLTESAVVAVCEMTIPGSQCPGMRDLFMGIFFFAYAFAFSGQQPE